MKQTPFKVIRTNATIWGKYMRAGGNVVGIVINNLPDVLVTDRLQDLEFPERTFTFNFIDKTPDCITLLFQEKIQS